MTPLTNLIAGLRDQKASTLIETAIGALILSIVLTVTLGLLDSGQKVASRTQERSANNDQIRMAVEQLDREIRSGNLVYPPAEEEPLELRGWTLRVFTQSNKAHVCVQWRIDDQELQRRSWRPSYGETPSPTGWRVVAEDIVNRQLGRPAFETTDPHRTVDISLLANGAIERRASQTVEVRASVTGRNNVNNFPVEACQPAPAS